MFTFSGETRRGQLRRCEKGLAFFNFFHFSVDHVVVSWFGFRASGCAACGLGCLHVSVDFFAQLLRGGHQGFGLGIDGGFVFAFQCFFNFLDGRFDGFFFASVELVAVLALAFLHAVISGFSLVV